MASTVSITDVRNVREIAWQCEFENCAQCSAHTGGVRAWSSLSVDWGSTAGVVANLACGHLKEENRIFPVTVECGSIYCQNTAPSSAAIMVDRECFWREREHWVPLRVAQECKTNEPLRKAILLLVLKVNVPLDARMSHSPRDEEPSDPSSRFLRFKLKKFLPFQKRARSLLIETTLPDGGGFP